MQATELLSKRSIDQLESDIICLAQRVNATEYEFLVAVREFDLRQGWKAYHFNNCAEWLDMKCGIRCNTAREKVRVSRALFDLPATSSAFQQGKLSYSKARSLTRVAAPHNETQLVEYALGATAKQVDEHCQALRNVQKELSTPDANRTHHQRYLSRTFHRDGTMTISVELPRESGELVMKALEYAMSDLEANEGLEKVTGEGVDYGDELELAYHGSGSQKTGTGANLFQRQADALVRMAQGYLAGGKDNTSCTADHYQVMLHVDENALRGAPDENSKSDLPIETVRRLCCDSALVTVTEDQKGNPLHVGRKHRTVQPALRRALSARDGCCRFPGCSHTRWLDAHHVEHWADGGETSLDNTILLCSTHHRLLHEGGFRIKKDCNGEFQFNNR
jgi:hypothetical protein